MASLYQLRRTERAPANEMLAERQRILGRVFRSKVTTAIVVDLKWVPNFGKPYIAAAVVRLSWSEPKSFRWRRPCRERRDHLGNIIHKRGEMRTSYHRPQLGSMPLPDHQPEWICSLAFGLPESHWSEEITHHLPEINNPQSSIFNPQ
jgi:hypothetical protein